MVKTENSDTDLGYYLELLEKRISKLEKELMEVTHYE